MCPLPAPKHLSQKPERERETICIGKTQQRNVKPLEYYTFSDCSHFRVAWLHHAKPHWNLPPWLSNSAKICQYFPQFWLLEGPSDGFQHVSSEEQGITFSTTFASWLQDKHPSARPSEAPHHWGPHSCCPGYLHHLRLHLCQATLSLLCIGAAMLHKDLASTLHQLPCSAKVSQRVMSYAETVHSNRYFWVFFPVVLLLDSQGTLEQVLLLAVVTQVSMRNAQICQSHCYFGMFFPVVLLLDSQGTLEQVLLLPVVA